MDKSRVEPTFFFIEKISFSLKLFAGHFYGQSFIKTVRGPLNICNNIDRSHDGFDTRSDGILEPKSGSTYASQRIVFDNLGQGVLDNAFEGKNIFSLSKNLAIICQYLL